MQCCDTTDTNFTEMSRGWSPPGSGKAGASTKSVSNLTTANDQCRLNGVVLTCSYSLASFYVTLIRIREALKRKRFTFVKRRLTPLPPPSGDKL